MGDDEESPVDDRPDPVAARIQELATQKLSSKFMVHRELKSLPHCCIRERSCSTSPKASIRASEETIVVTDRRVMFVEHGVMRSRLEDFPYERVSSVQSQAGVMMGGLTIYASGNAAEISDVSPKERAHEIGEFVSARSCIQVANGRLSKRRAQSWRPIRSNNSRSSANCWRRGYLPPRSSLRRNANC